MPGKIRYKSFAVYELKNRWLISKNTWKKFFRHCLIHGYVSFKNDLDHLILGYISFKTDLSLLPQNISGNPSFINP